MDGAWQAILLFLRLVAVRDQVQHWRRGDAPALQQALASRPSLLGAARRPYISTAWDASRRLVVIAQHYAELEPGARGAAFAPHAVRKLATVESRGRSVEIVLDSPAWFMHEGEATLNLFQGGERVYTLVFSLGLDGEEPVAYVGALQGLGSGGALDLYRSLTHAMHGLRPRDLLIVAFRSLCRAWGLARWLAVDDRHRVSSSDYFRMASRVPVSYDAVWREHGGQLRADGFYDLPVAVCRRPPAEIPARKRSAYRQRYAMLDRLEDDLLLAVRCSGNDHGSR